MISPHEKTDEFALYETALQWYSDHGVDTAVLETPENHFISDTLPSSTSPAHQAQEQDLVRKHPSPPDTSVNPAHLGASEARQAAVELAKHANDLETLREAIAAFDGLSVKRTATNMVFSDGSPDAPIMIVGEAPGADDDRKGLPFVGVSGQLLDKILQAIDLNRHAEAAEKSVYISNILNWRPPGNRTPNAGEIEVSLPFIEKHIMLVQPKILVLCGSVAAQSLLGRSESISRLRKVWNDYRPQTEDLVYTGPSIPTIATYHPSYLLRTPTQKRAAWQDFLTVSHKLKSI